MNERYRELTPAAVIGGAIAGAILNVGIVFAGMQIGFTIVGSTVGAILGFGFLRGILRRGSILEVNIFQTIASSVNTVNSGVIFTVPVLFLLGLHEDAPLPYTGILLACIAGSVLGVVVIIPLRKQIIDYERLRFPSAVAVATILKSPGAGVTKAVLLVSGILLSALVTAASLRWSADVDPLLPDSLHLGEWLHLPAALRLVLAVSLLSFGAGFIAGKPGLAVLYGTILNFWILIPLCSMLGWVPELEGATSLWGTDEATHAYSDALATSFRGFTANKVGIGMILGGALAGIVVALPALKAAIASLRTAGAAGERQEEASLSLLFPALAAGLLLLFGATMLSAGETIGLGKALLVTLVGAVWLWLAGLVVAQTTGRTDWSPLSGLALIAIALMMGIMGTERQFIVPAVTVGAAICVATSMCADMMADLKTGYLVGGRPLRQAIAQMATCWIGPGIALATVVVLWNSTAFGPDQARILYEREVVKGPDAVLAYEQRGGSIDALPEGTPELGAPQAGALQGAIEIVQGGDIPLGKYLTGATLGMAVSLLASPGIGVMIGLSMYLPFKYMIVFGMGGLLSMFLHRTKGMRFVIDRCIPVAAGLIVGDALVNVVNAIVRMVQSVA